jgi:type III pantothenate kinase
MLLTIDVGNTQTHIGMFSGTELVEHWRFATRREATGDEIAIILVSLLDLHGHRLTDVDGAIVSSVVPQLGHEYERVSERYFGGTLLVVGPGVKTGMPIRTENPHEVGADRLPNVDIEPPRELIGRSTVASIQSGIVYGFAGQVDGIVGRLREHMGDDLVAIATGGLASSIAPFCDQIDETDDLLTLTGLRLIWERNRS